MSLIISVLSHPLLLLPLEGELLFLLSQILGHGRYVFVDAASDVMPVDHEAHDWSTVFQLGLEGLRFVGVRVTLVDDVDSVIPDDSRDVQVFQLCNRLCTLHPLSASDSGPFGLRHRDILLIGVVCGSMLLPCSLTSSSRHEPLATCCLPTWNLCIISHYFQPPDNYFFETYVVDVKSTSAPSSWPWTLLKDGFFSALVVDLFVGLRCSHMRPHHT